MCGRLCRAHCVYYEHWTGIKVPDDLCGLHRCDTPSCVNPEHIFIGTNDDNVKDRVSKGRSAAFHGEDHPIAKLNREQVLIALTSTETARNLANQFGVTPAAIRHIRQGRSWTSISKEFAATSLSNQHAALQQNQTASL